MNSSDGPFPLPQNEALFLDAPVPYFLLDAQGWILQLNRSGEQLLGEPGQACGGRPFAEWLDPDSRPLFDQWLGACQDGDPQRGEVRLRSPDGPARHLRLDLWGTAPMRLLATDISDHREEHAGLERQLEEHAARVRDLNAELESVLVRTVQQLQAPATRAMNFLAVLRRALDPVPEAARRPLLNTERSIQQIIAIFSSIDRYIHVQRMRPQLRPVDLNRVLREVLRDVQPLMVDRRVEVTADHLPTVQGDSWGLFVVLNEYLSNALKFTRQREAARIHICVRETGEAYHIGVEDNGVGFDPRMQERLFTLFVRLHPSSTYEGSGLGLATVRQVCESFGGRAWGEGRPGEGATFWMAWPKQPVLRG